MLVATIFRLDRNIYLMWDRGTLLVTKGTSPRNNNGKRKKKGQDPFKDIHNNIISEHLYLRGVDTSSCLL